MGIRLIRRETVEEYRLRDVDLFVATTERGYRFIGIKGIRLTLEECRAICALLKELGDAGA
jgi:hypothetical protein